MAFTAGTHGTTAEINVTPLIDVLLVLLIIFMVIAPVPSHGLGAGVPQAGPGAEQDRTPSPIVVQVSYRDDGAAGYAINQQQQAGLEELGRSLATALSPRQNRMVFLQADARLDLREVVRVVNTVRLTGASGIALLTRKDCNLAGC